MKKTLITLFSIICFAAAGFANPDNDKLITVEQLPAAARNFIKQYFSTEKIATVKMDVEFSGTTYDVDFASGKEIEFDKNGNWIDIDCKTMKIPDGIVPVKILSKVKELYPVPHAFVVSIDRKWRDTEVELNNGNELKFDSKYNLVKIDKQ